MSIEVSEYHAPIDQTAALLSGIRLAAVWLQNSFDFTLVNDCLTKGWYCRHCDKWVKFSAASALGTIRLASEFLRRPAMNEYWSDELGPMNAQKRALLANLADLLELCASQVPDEDFAVYCPQWLEFP